MNKLKNYIFIIILFNALTLFASPNDHNRITDKEDNFGYLSDLERKVIDELNFARMQPSEYADYLIAYSELFVGRELRERGEITVLTKEGRSAVNEAIRFLRNQKPLPYLIASKGMSKAAEDMVRMQGTTAQIGHKGRDGSTFAERVSRYGTWEGSCSENIDYGNNNARRIVMALIIDDGVSNRGHRKSIFNPAFKRVGLACGQHQRFQYMCVIELAARYAEN
ncbi:MAG TPA: CAP domain-containing protein [Prolixibacteraceae bacterium]|nr:CAP domain-containing protein [Prolixibacteraceae bacterium]